MGQAFRRAAGRTRPTSHLDQTTAAQTRPAVHQKIDIAPNPTKLGSFDSDGMTKQDPESALEEKDPQYDAMLSQIVGRIRTKPGGKPEMGDAYVVEKYKRPLPKLRNTTPDSSRYEERSAPAGTLNVAQLRQIILLYQGKAEEHAGPMEMRQTAEKFRVDVAHLQSILQHVALPLENSSEKQMQS